MDMKHLDSLVESHKREIFAIVVSNQLDLDAEHDVIKFARLSLNLVADEMLSEDEALAFVQMACICVELMKMELEGLTKQLPDGRWISTEKGNKMAERFSPENN